jgi:hypothetical protein
VEGGRWKLEVGRWKVKAESWKVEGGSWKVEGGRILGTKHSWLQPSAFHLKGYL